LHIREDIYLYIEATADIPTATADLSGVRGRIYTHADYLITELPESSLLRIYSFNGILIKQQQAPSGTTQIPFLTIYC
ncbi:MAG: hypothetical protein LIP05_02640, partial [Tannerellaceae bacterium]|nr:hypothetical protein [Tannerellaceae bacterium]